MPGPAAVPSRLPHSRMLMSGLDRTSSVVPWVRMQRVFLLGLKSLWLHRLRSLLTALGIVFGVCSVIAMLAIGEGASFEAQERIRQLGSQNIILRSVKPPEEQKVGDQGQQSFVLEYGLTYRDIQRIQETIPGVTVVVPGRVIRDYVWQIDRRVDCEVVGTVPWYPEMRNHTVSEGRFFTAEEMANRASVCVIGSEIVPLLFPIDSPIGRDVRIRGNYYRVVGVMASQSRPTSGLGNNAEAMAHRLFLPLETAKMRFGEVLRRIRSGSIEQERVELHEVTVQVAGLNQVLPVAQAIQVLLEHHRKKRDFAIDVPLEMLRQAEHTKRIFNIVLGSIAAISLLVGGIGIMNIMLASVTERTREIGVRRALGAKRRDIIVQFLVETVTLSGAGGFLGVLLGLGIPLLVTQLAGMKTIVTPWAPILAFSISALVGIVFGLYPALRAARMDPVEALRHE